MSVAFIHYGLLDPLRRRRRCWPRSRFNAHIVIDAFIQRLARLIAKVAVAAPHAEEQGDE